MPLKPMQPKDFDCFLEREIRGYAEEHIRNGNWEEDGALEKSRKEFEQYLPNGIHTPDQYVWSIVDEENRKMGALWVEVKKGKAFIYDFVIDEEFRGKGFGKQALAALDEKLKSMDVASVSLHVFGDNVAAQELYKKMGFIITDMHMTKYLAQS